MTEANDLEIEFKGRHETISERMRGHATKKITRLSRYNDRVVRIEVVTDKAHENPEVELIAHMRRGAPVVAKDRGTSFSSTIDLVVEKLEKQLKRQKEKRKDHKNGGGKAEPPQRGRSRGTPIGEETYEEVVRRTLKGYTRHPLSSPSPAQAHDPVPGRLSRDRRGSEGHQQGSRAQGTAATGAGIRSVPQEGHAGARQEDRRA
jgi:putative sigma-54 modulation protein